MGAALVNSQVCRERSQTGETRREEHTDVADVNGHVDPLEEAPDETSGHHETGVDGATDGTSERVPCCWVKPVPELLFRVSTRPLLRCRVSTHVEAPLHEDTRSAAVSVS